MKKQSVRRAILLIGCFVNLMISTTAQKTTSIEVDAGTVCNYIGVDLSDVSSLDIFDFNDDDEIIKIYNDVLELLGIPDAKFTLKGTLTIKNAIVIPYYQGKRLIIINKKFFETAVMHAHQVDDILYMVIAHEVVHHINGDLFNYNEDKQYENHIMELKADNRAGYVLGKRKDVTLYLIENVFNNLISHEKANYSHPSKKERFYHIYAGWIEARFESKPQDTYLMIGEQGYVKTDYYLGMCSSNKKPEGMGVLVFEDTKYIGDFVNRNANGFGTIYYADSANNSNRYVGNWKNRKTHGFGNLYWKSGSRYEGYFKEGLRDSMGTTFYYNGDKYIGEYKKDEKEGEGVFYDSETGGKYEGGWKNGLKHGYGTYYGSDDIIYSGEYMGGERHGIGVLFYGNTIYKFGVWGNGDFITDLMKEK